MSNHKHPVGRVEVRQRRFHLTGPVVVIDVSPVELVDANFNRVTVLQLHRLLGILVDEDNKDVLVGCAAHAQEAG